jgi:hypothetical protein
MSAPKKSAKERLAELMAQPLPRAKPKAAMIFQFPPKLSEQELCRRQAVIDACWERTQAERRELEAEAARSCHLGPGDPDYWRQ